MIIIIVNSVFAQKRGTISTEGGTLGGKGQVVTYPMPGVGNNLNPGCPPMPRGGSVGLQCFSEPGIVYGTPTKWECRWVILYPKIEGELFPKTEPLPAGCVEPQPPLPGVSVNKCAEYLVGKKPNPTGFCDCIANAGDTKALPGTLLNSCCKAVGGNVSEGFAGPQCVMPVPETPTDGQSVF